MPRCLASTQRLIRHVLACASAHRNRVSTLEYPLCTNNTEINPASGTSTSRLCIRGAHVLVATRRRVACVSFDCKVLKVFRWSRYSYFPLGTPLYHHVRPAVGKPGLSVTCTGYTFTEWPLKHRPQKSKRKPVGST